VEDLEGLVRGGAAELTELRGIRLQLTGQMHAEAMALSEVSGN